MARRKQESGVEASKPVQFWENCETEIAADWIIHSYRWQTEARKLLANDSRDMAITELASRMRQSAMLDSHPLHGLCRELMEETLRSVQWTSLAERIIQTEEAVSV